MEVHHKIKSVIMFLRVMLFDFLAPINRMLTVIIRTRASVKKTTIIVYSDANSGRIMNGHIFSQLCYISM